MLRCDRMEPPFRYVDSSGRSWDVYDFKIVQGRKRRVPINGWDAEARAFVAADTGDVLIYRFGYIAYRVTEPKILADQIRFAKPLQARTTDHNGNQPNAPSLRA